MRLDSAGLPFIGGALLVGLISGVAVTWALALPFILLAGFFAFFFRDPERVSPADGELVLSPRGLAQRLSGGSGSPVRGRPSASRYEGHRSLD